MLSTAKHASVEGGNCFLTHDSASPKGETAPDPRRARSLGRNRSCTHDRASPKGETSFSPGREPWENVTPKIRARPEPREGSAIKRLNLLTKLPPCPLW